MIILITSTLISLNLFLIKSQSRSSEEMHRTECETKRAGHFCHKNSCREINYNTLSLICS